MVVHTKDEKRYGDAQSLVGESSAAQNDIEQIADQLRESMTEFHALQDQFEQSVKRQEKSLKHLARAIKSEANKRSKGSEQPASVANESLDTRADAAGPSSAASSTEAHSNGTRARSPSAIEKTATLKELRCRMSAKPLQQLMPATGGFYVELFLGTLNVRFMRKKDRLAFKTEYEKLKLKVAPGLVIIAILCLVYEENRWVHMVLQLCLAWYYATLAVRENILRLNGSNIKAWWIIHHYFTMAQCVFLLTWPNNASYARSRRNLHLFGFYNAVLQIFQTRYQMARLYALRSLGMASEMDVAASDSTQIHWSEGMIVLLPLILLGQAMQAGMAWNLMRIFNSSPNELQILMMSLLFCANFVGNFYTTLVVLYEKRIRSCRAARHADETHDKRD